MEISIIPLQAIPNQTFTVYLNDKECEIHVYLRYTHMYMDLTVEDKVIFQGMICLNNVDLIQFPNLGVTGNFKFIDTQGNEDPYYSGFNERWFLTYVQ